MAVESARFQPGRPGCPGKSPGRGPELRAMVRRALRAPADDGSGETLGQAWARSLLAEARTTADRMMILRWLDEPSPSRRRPAS